MLRRKLIESLTARIFFITVLILLGAGAVTFALIAWATPSTYTAVVNDDLQQQVDALAKRLKNTDFEDSGPVLEEFIRTTRADVALLSPDGKSELSPPAQDGEYTPEVSASQVTVYNDGDGSVSITSLQQASIFADVTFANRNLQPVCEPLRQGGKPGGSGPDQHGSLASSGAADFLPAVRLCLLPLHYPAHSPFEPHRRRFRPAEL